MKPSALLPLLIALACAEPLQHALDNRQHPIKPSPPSSPPISEIPALGLGLWNIKPGDVSHAISSAFSSHYTHLDGAAAYSNEKSVGSALSNKHAPARHTYWLTSKLWNTMHRPINVPKAFNKTLSELNTTYLDLYLMHWPVAFLPDKPGRNILDQDTSIADTWRAMEALAYAYHATNGAYGARHIGISNFSPRQIDTILKICTICPHAHEFETHPYLQQVDFVDWHNKHDIKVIAYSPLANLNPTYKKVRPDLPPILEDKFWIAVAEKKNCTVAQAVLAWNVARGAIVIPKSVHRKRIEENFGALKVEFSSEELREVAKEDRRVRFNNPGNDWGVSLFEGLDGASTEFVVDGEL